MKVKPNILFILTDDQGIWSLGCYGNKEVISPNLDKLADEGKLFKNFFCTSPVCSPARASIMTGLLPSQHGVIDWLGGGSVRKSDYDNLTINLKKAGRGLVNPVENLNSYSDDAVVSFKETKSYQHYMTYETEPVEYLKEFVGYTDVLSENGYTCGLSGKWHLGDSLHNQKGFSYWRTIARGGTQYSCPEYVRDGEITIGDRYITDVITEDAIEFIESTDDESPFYLSVHYTAPHDPWEKDDQPEEIWNLYDKCKFESTPDSIQLHPDQFRGNRCPEDEYDRQNMVRGYYTTITAMDYNIGKIIECLKKRNVYENTVIVFTSDNGFNMGHHGVWGKGNGTIPFNMYEDSVKVPMLIGGASWIKKGIITELVSQYDIFPTILELAGIGEYQRNKNMPGTSFKGLLEDTATKFREEVVVYDEYGPVRMIRTEEYKYIRRIPGGPDELYHIAEDPEEMVNLIHDPAYRATKVEMYSRLNKWFEQYVDPRYDASKLPIAQHQTPGKISKTGQCNRIEELCSNKVVFPCF